MNVNDIALTLERGFGAISVARLLEIFGTADEIYASSLSELVFRGELREAAAKQFQRKDNHHRAEAEVKYVAKNGLTAIASTDDEYPPMMREMADYPHVIYVQGDPAALRRRCVSMVGTRRLSTYGQTMCDRLVRGLAERVPDLCVVSGLAFGADVNFHRAALRYGVPTVAVLPCALPEVVPAQHANVARDIVASGGALVTELHSQSKQKGEFYLPRNRLIAGLSGGTVVVEAPFDSGAIQTAELALGYDRTLMAVPGRATDEVAWGTNALIKNTKAAMVCSGEDIIRAQMWDVEVDEIGARPAPAAALLSGDANGLLTFFESGNAVSVDGLGERTALSHSVLAPILLELEFAGRIRRLPGGMYERI